MKKIRQIKKWLSVILLLVFLCTLGNRTAIYSENVDDPVIEGDAYTEQEESGESTGVPAGHIGNPVESSEEPIESTEESVCYTDEPVGNTGDPAESTQEPVESIVESLEFFMALSVNEQSEYMNKMDEEAFFWLLEDLINEGILIVGDDGFESGEATETQLSEEVLFALEEKYLLLSGVPMMTSLNANVFSPSSNVEISGNRITLLGDVTMQSQMQVSNGDDIMIDLNGHVLEMLNNGCYFMVQPGGKLTIDDTAGGGVVYNKTYLVWLYNGGTFNLIDGIIDGSKVTGFPQLGGAVYIASPMNSDAVFNMYGGTIQSCQASQYGGAVYVAPPSSGHHCYFNMYGGSILNCSSQGSGGAIYVGSQGTDRSTVHLEGRSKITLLGNRCGAGGRGGAIYSDGKVEISGILDIGHGKTSETGCDSVYIDKNNWSGYVPEYLDVTGRLVVVGDGYIDLDTNYPAANAVVQGHTVVKNSAGLTPEEFYTYGSYFINSTRNLTVSAGFDPEKNDTTSEKGPSNWHTYNSDTGNFDKQTYVDVMGQTMYIEASSEPGKRQYQDYNYLIYTERSQPSDPILEYFTVKIVKKDQKTGELLDGACFSLTGTVYDVYGTKTDVLASGVSGKTGDATTGVSEGETYIYSDTAYNQKLMLRDGVYTITETEAPGDYTARESFVKLRISHDNSGEVSVVIVEANDVTLMQETNQVISSQYSDMGYLIEHEIVLEVNNTKDEPKPEPPAVYWMLNAVKYGTASTEGNTLGGAGFSLYEAGTDEPVCSAVSADDSDSAKRGLLTFRNADGSSIQLLPGKTYILREQTAPSGYTVSDDIIIAISEDGSSVSVKQKDMELPSDGTGNRVSIDPVSHTISLAIVDEAVYVLPETGRSGYYLMLFVGVLLMTGTTAGYISLRRKQY